MPLKAALRDPIVLGSKGSLGIIQDWRGLEGCTINNWGVRDVNFLSA